MPVHDLRCTDCGNVEPNMTVKVGCYTPCPLCGGARTWLPFVFNTDVYGSTKTSQILHEDVNRPATYSSRRELEAKMKRLGFEPCGDKVGGARDETVFRGTSYSAPGLTSRGTPRATTTERET